MSGLRYVHIVDHDCRRRAQIAYELMSRGLHAEIYENVEEFASRVPDCGAVLIADDSADCSPSSLHVVLQAAGCPLPVAAYAGDPSPQRIVIAMLEGAVDYLRWPLEGGLLEAALERLSQQGERLASLQRRRVSAKAAVDALSEREFEVLQLMIHGLSNKEIGRELGISPRTVEIHRGNMMRKLNARSPSDAVRVAMHAGLDDQFERERLAAAA